MNLSSGIKVPEKRLVNPISSNDVASDERSAAIPRVGRLRALDLGLRAFGGGGDVSLEELSTSLLRADRLADLPHALPELAGVMVTVEPLGSEEIRRRVSAGASVLIPGAEGWVVVASRAGGRVRATLVGRDTERRISWRRAAAAGEQVPSVLVMEPYLALESLSAREAGSNKPWSRLRAFVRLERSEVAALVVYAVALGGLSLAVPVAVQVLVNTIAFGSLLQPLVVLAVLLLVVLGFSGVIRVVSWYAVEIVRRRIFVRTAEDFARRLISTDAEVHDDVAARELVNHFFEVVGLQKAVGRLLLDGLGLALQTLVGMGLLAFYHPVLFAFDIVLVFALAVVVALGYGAVPTAIEESRAKYRVAAWLQTIAAHPTLFAQPSAGLAAATTADALTREYIGARRTHYRRVLRQLVGGVAVQVFAFVALLGIGGWLVMRGELTLGQLVAAELVVGVIGAGFAKVGKHLEAVYDLVASLDKVGKVVDLPSRGQVPVGDRGARAVTATGVCAHRGKGPRTRPIDLRLAADSRVRLCGAAGSGKSAWLEVLAGHRSAAAGRLELDGTPVTHRGRLLQRGWLLRPGEAVTGSVLDNLRLGDPTVDEERAWEVLRVVGLGQRIAALPGGLDARLRAGGRPLSRGESDRLCVARALVASPQLLLVDGALDGLGLPPSAERSLLDAILGPDAPWAVVVVSERAQVIEHCTEVVSLDPAEHEEAA